MDKIEDNSRGFRVLAGPYDLSDAYDIAYLASVIQDTQKCKSEFELRPSTDLCSKGSVDVWCRYSQEEQRMPLAVKFLVEAGKEIRKILNAGKHPIVKYDKGYIHILADHAEYPDFRESLLG